MNIEQNKALWFIMLLLGIVFLGVENSRTGDFDIYYTASTLLFEDQDIYARLYGTPRVFDYFGSPFLTLLISIFTLVPIKLATILFKLLNLILLFRIWKLIEKYLDFKTITIRHHWWVAFSFLAISFPLYRNFHNLQLTIILIYCLLEGLHQIRDKKRDLLGASIIAIGIMTKVSPIVIIPYLIYRRHFKAVSYLIVVFGLLLLLPSLFLGWEKNLGLWASWWEQINPGSEANEFDMNSRKNHGVGAWLASLLIEGIRHEESTLELRRHLIDLTPEKVKYIILTVRLLLAGFMLYFLRSLPFQSQSNKQHQLWEISYLLLVIPLIFPQQRIYNFLFLLPAVSYIIYHLLKATTLSRWIKYLAVIGIVLLNFELILGEFRYYYWHYKLLTYATLIILIPLATIKPSRMNS